MRYLLQNEYRQSRFPSADIPPSFPACIAHRWHIAGFRLSLPYFGMQFQWDLSAEVARFFCHSSSSNLFNGKAKIPESKRESYYQSQLKIPFQIKRNDHSHPLHEVFHTGYGHAVAEGFVACGVRSAGNIGPAIWIALEPFALQRCEAANEIPAVRIPGSRFS